MPAKRKHGDKSFKNLIGYIDGDVVTSNKGFHKMR